MSKDKPRFRQRLAWALFVVIALFAVSEAVMMRFVLYRSQNRALAPADYDIQVVTADDFRALSDPGQSTVQLADGTTLVKAEGWDPDAFKAVGGGTRYVRVTTKGTAHVLPHLLPWLLVFAAAGVAGALLTWPRRPA